MFQDCQHIRTCMKTKTAKGCKIGLIPCENASTLNVFFYLAKSANWKENTTTHLIDWTCRKQAVQYPHASSTVTKWLCEHELILLRHSCRLVDQAFVVCLGGATCIPCGMKQHGPPAFHVAWMVWTQDVFFTIKLIDCHWIVWTSFHSMHNLWVESIYLSQRGQYIDAPWRANILTRRINILPRPQGLMTQMGGTHRSNWQDFVNVCQYIRHIGNNDSASATKHGRNIQEDGISDTRPVSWLSIRHQILLTCQFLVCRC